MDFPGNSHNVLGEGKTPKPEQPPKDIQKVVTGEVVQRKKPLGRRFKDIFFKGDFRSATKYVVNDVLVPAFKNMILDAGNEGLKRSLYGDAPRRRYEPPGAGRVMYNSILDREQERYSQNRTVMIPDQPPYNAPRRRQDVGELILISREEAELVVERMTDILDRYKIVTVADLHDLVGLPTTYVDNKWGWSSIRGVDIRQVREGFLIDFPPQEPIA